MSYRGDFIALDQLTLAEIEAMFGMHSRHSAQRIFRSLREPEASGRAYMFAPGATFYEVEDLRQNMQQADFIASRSMASKPDGSLELPHVAAYSVQPETLR